ncbi:MAG TPA: NapC/NirT family cytochrome c [Burkholderiaceae bacterium]|nr:NapC/NirT family cytochrome c [Burkholderiaceae bacterium]
MFREFWDVVRRRYPSTGGRLVFLLVCFVVVVAIGATLVIGGAAGLAWTDTEKFCLGCHEMRDNPYAEYKGTIHASNRTGVSATCPDCHVPREVGPLILRKMEASLEVWAHLQGVIDTKEKFEKQRTTMAQREWRRMKKSDSLACRNCHKAEAMSSELQSEKAQARHAKARAEGTTCIDCHFGIAHKEPEGPGPKEIKFD